MSEPTNLTVNGRAVQIDADERTPLLLALRNQLGLKGARAGCAIGECGSCTVLADGEPIRACLLPLGEAAGRVVVTPEGLGTPDDPHPVQQAFLDTQAAQCGYCINGMIMTVASLCDRPEVTTGTLRDSLEEHLCRCGTHSRVLRAGCRALGLDAGPSPVEVVPAGGGPDATWNAPAVLGSYPDVASWLRLEGDGRIAVLTGKVELGQGIRTAIAQVAAAQLGVELARVVLVATSTTDSPDEGYTAGSNSVDTGGAAVGAAAVAFRRLLLDRAAAALDEPVEQLRIEPAGSVRGTRGAVTFAQLAADGPVTGPIGEEDRPDWDLAPLAEPREREDLRRKLTGAPAYVHDLDLEGMVHARVLLPPTDAARLRSVDTREVEAMPGVVRVHVDGSLVMVVAEREEQAVFAVARLRRSVAWDDPGLPDGVGDPESLRSLPSEPYVAAHPADEAPSGADVRTVSATYRRPYQAHGSIAPSCAVAVTDDRGRTKIWTHTQGVFPLQRELAVLLHDDEEAFDVEHRDGPGCYGQNLADDAAAFAAIAARALPGRPVRFLFTVDDELSWEPYGSAMVVDLQADLDASGGIVRWQHRGITDAHSATRPNGGGTALLAAQLRERSTPRAWPGASEGGARNAVPVYALPSVDVVTDHVEGRLRVGSLRSLGAFHNVFALESFMDELAELAGEDPVAFRLRHLEDPRARHVLELAAERVGWEPHVGPSGRGVGIAVARYKDIKAYVAQTAEVDVDPADGTFTVTRVVTVCDAGAIVNVDGLVNQLEGGTIQGLSRALVEQVRVGAQGIESRDWTTYPVLRFAQVPELVTVVLGSSPHPPLGAGEASTPPVSAAVANAVDDAIGIRLRDLPMTARQLEQRLLAADETEMQRVLLG